VALLDLLSAIVGFAVGAIVTVVVVEATARQRATKGAATKLTAGWRLTELADPMIVCHDLPEQPVPQGARIAASGAVAPSVAETCEVRQVPPVRAEFALDRKNRRALLFMAGLQTNGLALWTVDPELLARLETEADHLWERASPYVERVAVGRLAGAAGAMVETEGVVQDALQFQGRHLLRLQDEGHIVGVVVERDPAELRGHRVRVKGKLVRDKGGYLVIEAVDLRRIR
jgi:hypothetical protein